MLEKRFNLLSSDVPFQTCSDGVLEGSYFNSKTAYDVFQQCIKLMPNKCLAIYDGVVKKWEHVPRELLVKC
jgi:hypothetical protein